jgi:hypothetical protein
LSIKKTLLALAGIVLTVIMTGCDQGSDQGSDQGHTNYYETCQELNRTTDYYVDPDICAADARQLAEDLRQTGEAYR